METADARTGSPSGGPRRRLHQVFEATCDRNPRAVALEFGRDTLTYGELDAHANRLAHHLRGLGVGAGSRVAILVPRSVGMYVSLLAVGKAGAAFVPVDPESPPDRVSYIARNADVDLVLVTSDLASAADGLACPVVRLDSCDRELAAAPAHRPPHRPPASSSDEDDPAAYIIYTSGSSGRPKGVEISQSSICNFLDVVPGIYDVRESDRVHQGMTISFDFSVEEIWPTWAVGATVVAGPTGSGGLGTELGDFLREREITVFYCVPTLLETIAQDLPRLRGIVVGGEACPSELVERWSRPGRRMLNTYGPTEATVTATWTELRPGRPVTIGRPLPTYSVVLLDDRRRPVPDGEVGEICIGGPGVAVGYVARPELTAEHFIEHPLAPSGGRLYRTGDLGRMTADGEIEFLGRSDDVVKIRGHRVDTDEIDSLLLEDPEVAEAVTVRAPGPDGRGPGTELAAYVVRTPEGTTGEEDLAARLRERLARRLPAYMVPSFLDVLEKLPLMPSGKVDHRGLPAPSRRRLAGGAVVAAGNAWEEQVRDVWARVLSLDPADVSVEADFFTDLGGHSLLAARVVSELRGRGVGGSPSLRELYAHPTVRGLAACLAAPAQAERQPPPPRPEPIRHRGRHIAATGAGQAALFYVEAFVLTLPLVFVYSRHGGRITGGLWLQLTVAGLVSYVAARWVLPLLLVRPFAAGVRPGRYPVWGAVYLRLWAVDSLLSLSPLPLLSGSPLMAPYLRLLGARIGPRTTIATGAVTLPALLRIGADTSVGYGVSLRPWQVADGWVTIAPIVIGPDVYVGANAVVEPGTRMEAGSALGEQSVAGEGTVCPAGTRWAGSPAVAQDTLGPTVDAMMSRPRRDPGWHTAQLVAGFVLLAALECSSLVMVAPGAALFWWLALGWGVPGGVLAAVLFGPVSVLSVCAVVAAGKRAVLRRTPVGTHPARSWIGLRKWVSDKLLEASLAYTNSLYATLYTVPWLRLLGARIGRFAEVSTAAHLDPDLLVLSDGSFVADMANVGAAVFAGGQVSFGPTVVGRRAFVGNAACVSAGTRTGADSLIGVGTVPPREGVPDGTTWLGSPALALPVRQSSGSFPEALTFRPARGAVLQRLAIEYFRITVPATLLSAAVYAYLLALSAAARSPGLPVPALASPLLAVAAGLAVILCCAAVKWLVVGAYRPRVEPLWSLFVRRTELVTGLYEAAAVPAGVGLLVGTPFLAAVLRLFGARVGRRAWLGTTFLTEFDLVEIGDHATVGPGVSLQTHLFEDRVMKMSVVTVGSGASVGTRAIVLYDSVVGDGARLGTLSLLMKGERLTPGTHWRGIPAEGVTERLSPPNPDGPGARP